jgi:hypothetical protein
MKARQAVLVALASAVTMTSARCRPDLSSATRAHRPLPCLPNARDAPGAASLHL